MSQQGKGTDSWFDLERSDKKRRKKCDSDETWWTSKHWLSQSIQGRLKSLFSSQGWASAKEKIIKKKGNPNTAVACLVYQLWRDDLPKIHPGFAAMRRLKRRKAQDLNAVAEYIESTLIPFLDFCESEVEDEVWMVGIGQRFSGVPKLLRDMQGLKVKHQDNIIIEKDYDDRLEVGIMTLASHFKNVSGGPQDELIGEILSAAEVKNFSKVNVQQKRRHALSRSNAGRWQEMEKAWKNLMS